MYKILLLATLLFSCTPKIYNTPFINTDETTILDFGMTKEDVLNKLNQPLYVSYGDDKEIIWVYEVRTTQVQSIVAAGTVTPQKRASSSSNERHGSAIHKLSLTFNNGQLSSWEILDE